MSVAQSSRLRLGWRIFGVLLIASMLRPAVAAVGPLLPEMRHSLNLTGAQAGILTSLPVLCFGLAAFLGPYLAQRLGLDRALVGVLLLIAIGIAVRSNGGFALLLLGTTVLAGGTAVANVLLPALVKGDFADRVGVMTGAYTTMLTGGAAVSAALAVPLAHLLGGWRPALAALLVPAVITIIVWAPQAKPHDVTRDAAKPDLRRVLRLPLAWALAGYFGIQSMSFYGLLNWLPSMLQADGSSAVSAGAYLSLITLVGIPTGVAVTIWAGRRPDQRFAAVSTSVIALLGLLGLWIAPTSLTLLWSVLIGVGLGATFPLAMTFVALRSGDAEITRDMSAMMQGMGYVLAAAGTFAIGWLHDFTNGWTVLPAVLCLVTVVQVYLGWVGGSARSVTALTPSHAVGND